MNFVLDGMAIRIACPLSSSLSSSEAGVATQGPDISKVALRAYADAAFHLQLNLGKRLAMATKDELEQSKEDKTLSTGTSSGRKALGLQKSPSSGRFEGATAIDVVQSMGTPSKPKLYVGNSNASFFSVQSDASDSNTSIGSFDDRDSSAEGSDIGERGTW